MTLLTKYGRLNEDASAIASDESDTVILTMVATYSCEILFSTYKTRRCHNMPKINRFNRCFQMLLIFFCLSPVNLNNKNEQEIRTRKFGRNLREGTALENLMRSLMICAPH